MRTLVLAGAAGLVLAAALSAQPCLAQTAVDPDNVKAEDVAMSPLSDVGLHKKAVPVVLKAALLRPYDLSGIKTCAGFTTAINDLNVALGDDIDVAVGKTDEEKMENGAGAIAKSVIGSFIPFRGVIRELSGANANEREWNRALYAGMARRAFLKGMGEQRGCAYPARSATPEVLASLAAERAARKRKPSEATKGEPVKVGYDAAPVAKALQGSR